MAPSVYIMRGIPGSGKSTWIRNQWFADGERDPTAKVVVCSADAYFGNPYKFDFTKLGAAHTACFDKFIKALTANNGYDIVVDNTNTTVKEMTRYYEVARAANYPVVIVNMDCDPSVAGERNAHGVPLNKVWEMFNRLAAHPTPTHWNVTELFERTT